MLRLRSRECRFRVLRPYQPPGASRDAAAFAFVLGATVGVIVRRTPPALALAEGRGRRANLLIECANDEADPGRPFRRVAEKLGFGDNVTLLDVA